MKKLLTFLTPVYLAFIKPILAQDPPRLDLSDWGATLDGVVSNIVNVLIVIAVVMVMYAGIMYMFAAGDPGKIKQAQGTITWAVLGLVFVLLIKGILLLVGEVIS